MAPEQATADPTTDHRADLYSVGVLGYELLTGAPPFSGTAQQLITAHLTTPAPVDSACAGRRAAALADVIMRALAKEPADRPQSAREMIAALETVATPAPRSRQRVDVVGDSSSGETLASSPLGAASRSSRWPVYAWRARTPPGGAAAGRGRGGPDRRDAAERGVGFVARAARAGPRRHAEHEPRWRRVAAHGRRDDAADARAEAPSPTAVPTHGRLRRVGARSVLTGTLINEGDRVRASVTLREVGSDSAIATATALAAPRDIAALTDSLTWGILQQVWRRGTPPSPVLAVLTTRRWMRCAPFSTASATSSVWRTAGAARLSPRVRAGLELRAGVSALRLREFMDPQPCGCRGASTLAGAQGPAPGARAPLVGDSRGRCRSREDRRVEGAGGAISGLSADPDGGGRPDHPFGPLYGIPIERARPYLDRIVQLVPEHADTGSISAPC